MSLPTLPSSLSLSLSVFGQTPSLPACRVLSLDARPLEATITIDRRTAASGGARQPKKSRARACFVLPSPCSAAPPAAARGPRAAGTCVRSSLTQEKAQAFIAQLLISRCVCILCNAAQAHPGGGRQRGRLPGRGGRRRAQRLRARRRAGAVRLLRGAMVCLSANLADEKLGSFFRPVPGRLSPSPLSLFRRYKKKKQGCVGCIPR